MIFAYCKVVINNMKNFDLIKARKENGLTQVQLAVKCNISTRGYQYFEDGRIPNVKIAIRIADALEIADLRMLWKSQ